MSSNGLEYGSVREDIRALLDNPSWDDGSLTPILIRLAWHSSGTYDAATKTGGSNGAGMRFAAEADDPENAGLETARAFLETVKKKHPEISYSDLWILASYVALEETGGPSIEFHSGRVDIEDEGQCPPNGRLPEAEHGCGAGVDALGRQEGWESLAAYLREKIFHRMGMSDQETVALLCGGHVYGRCHTNRSGYAGAWVAEPTAFSNEYAADMLEDPWQLVDHTDTWLDDIGAKELRPAEGRRQYVNKMKPGGGGCPFKFTGGQEAEEDAGSSSSDGEGGGDNQMMLTSDMVLVWDAGFREHLEKYAKDEDLLKKEFGDAFKKVTELGCPWTNSA